MAEIYDEAFGYDWIKNRWAKLLEKQEAQYDVHIFPLAVIGAGKWELPNWLQGYEKHWEAKLATAQEEGDEDAIAIAKRAVADAEAFGEHLKDITEEYQISYIELDQDLAVDKVCDIFTQINSRGIRLDVFDLINALLKPKGLQLKRLWREAEPSFDYVKTGKMNVYILQVMSILLPAYCSPKYLYYLLPKQEKHVRDPDGTRRKEILIADTNDFKNRWDTAVSALQDAIKLLRHPQEYGAISSNFLPYVSILPAFAALLSHIRTLPAELRLSAQRKIRHWYWASVFTNRYSGSVESTIARDYLDVKEWIRDSDREPGLINEFKNRFRNLDLWREIKRGSSVYNGVFNLFVLKGARDFMTGNVPQHDDLDDHHIVPASWGQEHLGGNAIHTILNRTPLTTETNRTVIGARLPNEYLPEMIQRNGEQAVREILESHFISPEAQEILMRVPFTPDHYDAFIAERQRTLQEGIENLLVKQRLDLPPRLQELDARIEQVELNLRRFIGVTLSWDVELLPSHVLQKVDERLQRASRKNAALDSEYYETLSGKLEYSDLRELQDTITAKALWERFSAQFANKETLNAKFGQLAEIRNGIRHSRTLDEVTSKEGEAAIL